MPIRGPGAPGGRREWGSDVPTAIAVTSPDLALPATDRQTPAAVVLRAPHLQPLDDALTETSAVLEHHGHLIVLYSSACPPEHIRRLHTLRSVLESDRIAIVPLSLPPLGVALLARQLRQLSLCDFSPGVLASAARLLSHYVHAGALLGSVNGLDRIEVDLRSHVKSWLPGAHFAVLAHPEPRLLHLDRHSTEAGLPAPGFTTQLALARGQLTSEWVTAALAPAWQVQGSTRPGCPPSPPGGGGPRNSSNSRRPYRTCRSSTSWCPPYGARHAAGAGWNSSATAVRSARRHWRGNGRRGWRLGAGAGGHRRPGSAAVGHRRAGDPAGTGCCCSCRNGIRRRHHPGHRSGDGCGPCCRTGPRAVCCPCLSSPPGACADVHDVSRSCFRTHRSGPRAVRRDGCARVPLGGPGRTVPLAVGRACSLPDGTARCDRCDRCAWRAGRAGRGGRTG